VQKGRNKKIGGFFIERFSFIAVFLCDPHLKGGKKKSMMKNINKEKW